MRQHAAFTLALALGAIAAVALASCGGGEDAKLLPGTTAQEITENLDTVELLASEGECVGAANAAQEISTEVETLGGVDAKLKQTLQRGAERLNEVVATCEESSTEAVAPADEAPSTEDEEEDFPPGQEKKAEKEREKEEKALEKEEEKQEKEVPKGPATAPTETTPAEPPTTPAPPVEGGGTGAPGGVAPGAPVGEGE